MTRIYTSQLLMCVLLWLPSIASAEKPAEIIELWPAGPPGPSREIGPERDFTTPDDRHVAGRRVTRIGNVALPQAHVFLPPVEQRTGAAIVVCPGGGFHIVAWDLEGTEVAQWLNSLGVAAIVLKYRVPTRELDPRWLLPVQDAQRTISLVRHRADDWELDRERIGILGFSAGAAAAAYSALSEGRRYEGIDAADQLSCRPDLAVLIYPGALLDKDNRALDEAVRVTENAPPMFFVHAFDDRVQVENSLLLFLALKQASVPSELHVYDTGGHGYGLRPVETLPVTRWPQRCEDWLRRIEWLP